MPSGGPRDLIHLLQDKDALIPAFDQFTGYVGYPMAYYDHREGGEVRRHTYQSFGWQSDDVEKIASRITALGGQLKALGVHTVVWRTKPQFGMEDGKYRFYCRFHVLPYQVLDLHGVKPEAQPYPEA